MTPTLVLSLFVGYTITLSLRRASGLVLTANSEEILPLSEERGATGPFNALSRR